MSMVEMLSTREAKDLCDQLDLGTGLEPALQTIGGLAPTKVEDKKRVTQKKKHPSGGTDNKDEKTFKTEQKEAIINAIHGVFPNTKAEQLNALFDHAIVTNNKDVEVLWAASLYVSRGGTVDQALDYTSEALKDRKIRSLIKQEVKMMRKVSGLMQGLKRGDKELKEILKIIFVGC